MKKAEHFLESFMFNSRWLLAPFYLGLVLALALLLQGVSGFSRNGSRSRRRFSVEVSNFWMPMVLNTA